jgi:murein DD-endopeptidase MepM/ murein hydrolase activator NlpD
MEAGHRAAGRLEAFAANPFRPDAIDPASLPYPLDDGTCPKCSWLYSREVSNAWNRVRREFCRRATESQDEDILCTTGAPTRLTVEMPLRPNPGSIPVTGAGAPPSAATAGRRRPPPARWHKNRRRFVLVILAVATFVAAVFFLGPVGLIPFGLLLAFSTDSDEGGATWTLGPSPRNLGLAAAMVAAFAWFWLGYSDLDTSTLVMIAGTLIALPLALGDGDSASRGRTVTVTKRSLVLALWALVAFAYLYKDSGAWLYGLAAVCGLLPLAVAASRAWAARRGRLELGLLRHPFHHQVRAHLVQGLNIWLCCALLGGVLAAGGMHHARTSHSLNAAQFDVAFWLFAAGLVLLAALALVPRRRVQLATNVAVALFSGFLALQLVQSSLPPTEAVVLDSPLVGEWYVYNGGRSVLLTGHNLGEKNAVDFAQFGINGRTHTGGTDDPLKEYAGFGQPLLAPADGRIVAVIDHYADEPVGTNGPRSNALVLDIGRDRYVAMAHLKQGSVTVRVGDSVVSGQLLAEVGNNGNSSQPHLHLQVQDSPADINAERTYPMVFRNVDIIRGGPWPWRVEGELRLGDLVRSPGP